MNALFVPRFASRLVALGLLSVQGFLSTIAIQELALHQTAFSSNYAAQAKNAKSADQIYQENKAAIVFIDTDTGSGSGVILQSDGLIVTNSHVVNDASEIVVEFSNGRRVKAEVVSIGDPDCVDLALLRLSGEQNLPTVKVASPNSVVPGQPVFAMGFPEGTKPVSITQGIVSNTNAVKGWVQLDAALNPGNSGGALLNDQGQLIGINTRGRGILMNYAVAIDRMQAIVQATQNQVSPSIAAYIDLTSGQATQLATNQPALTGILQASDQKSCMDGSKVDIYTFQGQANQALVIEMEARSLNPYLILLGPDGKKLAESGTEGRVNRLYGTLPSDGTYTLIANSQKAEQTGAYSLQAVTPILLRSGELGLGDPTLQNGSPYRGYQFSGKAGQSVQVSVSSQKFPPFVIILDDQNKKLWEGRLDSGNYMDVVLPRDGIYRVVISTDDPKATGAFDVAVKPNIPAATTISRN